MNGAWSVLLRFQSGDCVAGASCRFRARSPACEDSDVQRLGSREELELLDAKRQSVNWRVIVLAMLGVALAVMENEL